METNKTVEEGKTMAIIAYVTLIGLIIAFISNSSKNNEFTSYHIRQSLGIVLMSIVLSIVVSILTSIIYIPFLSNIVYLVALVLIIFGLMNAAKGEKEPVPVVGSFFADIFKNLG